MVVVDKKHEMALGDGPVSTAVVLFIYNALLALFHWQCTRERPQHALLLGSFVVAFLWIGVGGPLWVLFGCLLLGTGVHAAWVAWRICRKWSKQD